MATAVEIFWCKGIKKTLYLSLNQCFDNALIIAELDSKVNSRGPHGSTWYTLRLSIAKLSTLSFNIFCVRAR